MAYGKLLGSSVDADKLSLTIKAFVPLALLVAGYFKLNISENEILEAVNVIGIVASGLAFLYGLARKVVVGLRENA